MTLSFAPSTVKIPFWSICKSPDLSRICCHQSMSTDSVPGWVLSSTTLCSCTEGELRAELADCGLAASAFPAGGFPAGCGLAAEKSLVVAVAGDRGIGGPIWDGSGLTWDEPKTAIGGLLAGVDVLAGGVAGFTGVGLGKTPVARGGGGPVCGDVREKTHGIVAVAATIPTARTAAVRARRGERRSADRPGRAVVLAGAGPLHRDARGCRERPAVRHRQQDAAHPAGGHQLLGRAGDHHLRSAAVLADDLHLGPVGAPLPRRAEAA